MAGKSANVSVRVEPEIKERAEGILADLGIPASTAINIFYRQVIQWNGMPFRPAKRTRRPLAVDEMTKEEFDSMMATGLEQAKAGQGMDLDEAFDRIMESI